MKLISWKKVLCVTGIVVAALAVGIALVYVAFYYGRRDLYAECDNGYKIIRVAPPMSFGSYRYDVLDENGYITETGLTSAEEREYSATHNLKCIGVIGG